MNTGRTESVGGLEAVHPKAYRRWVRVGLALGTLGFAAGTVSSYLVEPGRLGARVPEVATVLVGLVGLALSLRGRERLGATLFLGAAYAEIHASFFTYGILGPSLVVAPALVVAFGLFLGPRATLGLGALSVALTALAAWWDPLDPGFGVLEREQLLLYAFATVTVAVLTALGLRGLAQAGRRQREVDLQLQRSQRLAAVGTLAGGVAHDFNNLLTVIRGSADLVRLEGDPTSRALADEIVEASDRAAGIVRQLLTFAKRLPGDVAQVAPAAEVRRLEPLLRGMLGERIELRLETGATDRVLVDPGDFEEVLVNLVLNARDACPDGGAVTVSLTDVRRADSVAGVRLDVVDDGEGMGEAARARMFDPFYTTRGVGRPGLGLATVHGILEATSAEIEVVSAPGEGTRVSVVWPKLQDSTA